MSIGIGMMLGFMLLCVFIPSNVKAEGYVSLVSQSLSDTSPRQNECVDAEVTIKNSGEDQIRIYAVYLHFDWMPSNEGYKEAFSPAEYLASGQSLTIEYDNILIEETVTIGNHEYQFWVDYEEDDGWAGWSDEAYKSLWFTITVREKDTDGDGYGDSEDEFPNDSNEWRDTDKDGVGDNRDAFPTDPTENKDSDNDGVGDNSDAFPTNPSETKDSDKDGVGDNTDAFPTDPGETKDSDNDGVGDNTDAFPNDKTETKDSDGDGVGDNGDAFPNDSDETVDSDGDGVGDNSDDYPNDPTKTKTTGGSSNGGNLDDDTEGGESDGDVSSGLDKTLLVSIGGGALVVIAIFISIIVIISGKKKKRNKRTQKRTSQHPGAPRTPHISTPRPPRNQIQQMPPPHDTCPSTAMPQRHMKATPMGDISQLSMCPFCGKDLNFPKTPKFCPYCREQISM